ncbi:MAG: cell wall hydrolase [Rhodobacteraceae bacterium]|nr:MAG: cell wall hydrolase [Paracoccaceae bacterium]
MMFEPAHVLAAALALSSAGLENRHDPADVACLALNVYHEARGESVTGQAAVAHVTLNRVRNPRFPDSVCAVVTQQARGVCQFSWVCNDPGQPRNRTALKRAYQVAVDTLAGRRADPTNGATYFFSRRIPTPDWARRMRETTAIDNHRFFRQG